MIQWLDWLARHRRAALGLAAVYFLVVTLGHDVTQDLAYWAQDKLHRDRWNDVNRYVGVLVQDAAFMVTVPYFGPDTRPLKRNPVFLYSSDRFQKPYPFQADIAVAVKIDRDHEVDADRQVIGRELATGGDIHGRILVAVSVAQRIALQIFEIQHRAGRFYAERQRLSGGR